MRQLWLALSGLCLAVCLGGPAVAEEPYLEFLRGLRERQYFDTAIFYLDQLATRPDVPSEIRQVIPYEKALTLLESSKVSRSPEKQVEQLDQALAFLQQFVKESPNHPSVADANSEQAQILIGKARVEIVQSRNPVNQGAKGDYQKRARDYIGQARKVFDAALKQHETAWKSFGTFIDKAQFPEKVAAREKAEVNMIRAQLDLALCTYEEAQTYETGSDSYKKLLNDAAAAFEQMHQRYRSQVGGLYARLWQGKCFEELGDLQKALGVYNDLLSNPGEEPAMQRLKDQTLQFKLICLNSKERNDNQLAVDLGEEWLKFRKAEARTRVGLGIRWEVARAYEALGDRRDIPKEDAIRAWRMAHEHAEQVNRFPGEFHDMSLILMQRLDVKLGGKEKQPVTFDAAFGHGRQMVTAIKEQKDALDAAFRQRKPAEDIRKMQQDLDGQLKDAAKMFDLALRLANRQDDVKSINTARYMYAYVNFLQRKNYEAAILAEYVARTVDKDDATTGLDAAYLSMAAYVQAFNDSKSPPNEKQADINFIVKACNLLCDRWPDSDRANDARMTLGRIYSQLKQPVQAAEWYGKIPETDGKYSEAQLAAGQAYWAAYLGAGRMSDETRPSPEQLGEWQTLANQLLRNGIARMTATVPKEGTPPPDLIAGKMSLAQIVISQGQDAEAIKLLLDEPHSVIKAITVADETKRPDKGVQSRQFATETYKLLLRAYIGGGKLNEARETMKTLEKIAAGDAGSDVTDLYVGLGKLLQDELKRFQELGDTDRFNKLMTSFETFLNDLSARKEGQSFGSLSWIGETYTALGEASKSDAARSKPFFEKAAAAFQDLLNLSQSKPDFLTPDQLAAVKTRLAFSLRKKGDFEAADKWICEVLAEKEKDLRAQMEAAHLYQDWGDADSQNLLKAIAGVRDKKIWGWAQLGTRLQRLLEQGRTEYLPMFVEARLEGTESRRRYALAQTSLEKRSLELGKCETELVATISIVKGLTEEQFADFNQLYHKVLQDNGKPIVDLKPTKDIDTESLVAQAEPATKSESAAKKAATGAAKPAAKSQGGSTLAIVVVAVVLVLGIGGVGWWWMRQQNRKPAAARAVASSEPATVSFAGLMEPETPPQFGPPVVSIGAPAPKPRPRPAAASGAPAKPAAKPAQPKPKPKPPETK